MQKKKKKNLLFFFFIAFVFHIPNTKTQPNGTETECNRSVWCPFLTSRFRCSICFYAPKTGLLGQTAILGSQFICMVGLDILPWVVLGLGTQ